MPENPKGEEEIKIEKKDCLDQLEVPSSVTHEIEDRRKDIVNDNIVSGENIVEARNVGDSSTENGSKSESNAIAEESGEENQVDNENHLSDDGKDCTDTDMVDDSFNENESIAIEEENTPKDEDEMAKGNNESDVRPTDSEPDLDIGNTNIQSTDSDGCGSEVSNREVSSSSSNENMMTFTPHVMVNVEEFVYYSVRLGIKFQLLNNNIVVGPYFDGAVPAPVSAMLNAMQRQRVDCEETLEKRDSGVALSLMQSTLQAYEELEQQEEVATTHSLLREDIHLARTQTGVDDSLFCKELLSVTCKNTFLSYPPPKPSKTPCGNQHSKSGIGTRGSQHSWGIHSGRTARVLVGDKEKSVLRNRDGSIGWASLRRFSLTDSGSLSVLAPDSCGGDDDQSSPSFIKSTSSGATRVGDKDKEEECNDCHEEQLQASWADEQSIDVVTYYINASSVSPTSSRSSSLPTATATVTASVSLPPSSPAATAQVGHDPRSPSLCASSRSPAYTHPPPTSPVATQAVRVGVVVDDHAPFDRPASLSVQQEFMLRNGSIRSMPAAPSPLDLDLSAEISSESVLISGTVGVDDQTNDPEKTRSEETKDLGDVDGATGGEIEAMSENMTKVKGVTSKVVVQSNEIFGEGIKKIWKVDLPLVVESSSNSECVTWDIVKMLAAKFSLQYPFLETAESLVNQHSMSESRRNSHGGDDVEYLIEQTDASGLPSIVGAAEGKEVTVVVSGVKARRMTVLYMDEDIEDFVALEADTLDDFMAQNKKALRVDYVAVDVKVMMLIERAPEQDAEVEVEAEGSDGDAQEVCLEEREEVGDESSPLRTHVTGTDLLEAKCDVICALSPTTKDTVDNNSLHWRWLCRRPLRLSLLPLTESQVEKRLQQYLMSPREGSTLVAVNGIRVKDLDKGLVFSLLKQRQRPIVLEFESRLMEDASILTAGSAGTTTSRLVASSSSSTVGRLPASTFLAKYSHPAAKALRKQVDKLLKNFDGYDWVVDDHAGGSGSSGSSPQVFVTSLYRSVESELENLGLFDSSTPQGGGVPDMRESHWADVRMHIETLVFNSIYTHVKAMAPSLGVHELTSHPISGAPDQRGMVPLRTKCAFLSFLSLRDMGMALPEGVESPCIYALASPLQAPSVTDDSQLNVHTKHSEEWQLGMKELCRAIELKTPLKIMQRLRLAVMLLTHAVEGIIGRPLKYTDREAGKLAREEADGQTDRCENKDRDNRTVLYRTFNRPAGHYTPVTLGADELMPVLSWAIIQANPPDLEMAIWLCGEFRHPSNHMGECAYTLTQVSSALEFVKAATWRDFEVTEEYFRKGVTRFEVTQDLIALCARRGRSGDEGVKDNVVDLLRRGADVNGLSVDQSDTPLSAAVKSKHIEVIKVLLQQPNIDINKKVSPFFPSHTKVSEKEVNRKEVTKKEVSKKESGKKEVRKNEIVLQDFTALMLGAFTGQVTVVAMLLDHGADRYLVNEAGATATALARTGGHLEVVRVLMAEEKVYSLLKFVAMGDVYTVRGLLSQKTVDVNGSGVVCRWKRVTCEGADAGAGAGAGAGGDVVTKESRSGAWTDDEDEDDQKRVMASIDGTALHTAVYYRDTRMCTLLLHSRRVEVNKTNVLGETPLMWCGASNCLGDVAHYFDETGRVCVLVDPHGSGDMAVQGSDGSGHDSESDELSRVQMACALLSDQADRYAVDSCGRDAYHWAKHGSAIAAMGDKCTDTDAINSVANKGANTTADKEINKLDQMSFFEARTCRYPRLAAVLFFDPARHRIYHLARDGCIAGVRALLDQGISINASCPDGWYTPLIAAVYNKDIPMVRFLLQFSSIEVNFKGKNQTTALHYAAQEGSLSLCGLLLFHHADRNALTSSGLLPVDIALSKGHKDIAACLRFDPKKVSACLAAKHGDMNVFSALINQGVSVNAKLRHVSEKGTHHELTTPLIAAVSFGQLSFVRDLMTNKNTILQNAYLYSHIRKITTRKSDSGEDIDINGVNFLGQTALMYAAASGDEDMTLYLLKIGADRSITDKEQRTAAKWAKQSNHPALFMVLICDPSTSTVHEAIRQGNIDATIAFFKQEPNPNIRYFSTPLTTAPQPAVSSSSDSSQNVPQEVKSGCEKLLKVRGHPDLLDGESPLIVAAKHGQIPIIRLLLRAPLLEIDNVDTFGKTALMHACEAGKEEAVLLLLKHKSSRNAMCYSQKRAIDYAASSKHEEIVDILATDPYKVHIQDAAESGNARHVNALLKQGCPPNYQDERTGKRHRTALMCACSRGRLNVVNLLLSLSTNQSINVDLQDSDGMTALMHAAKIGNLEVTGALLSANCRRDIVDSRGKSAQNHASSHGFITGTQFKGQLMWR